jgi:hypothetical protein
MFVEINSKTKLEEKPSIYDPMNPKKQKTSLLEFVKQFLAVTMRFFAECYRKSHRKEKRKAIHNLVY